MFTIYDAVFEQFKNELEEHAVEIFLHPLPFTQINRLAMLAATVAQTCLTQQATKDEIDLLHTALDFLMENAMPFDDEDRIRCEWLIVKLINWKETTENV